MGEDVFLQAGFAGALLYLVVKELLAMLREKRDKDTSYEEITRELKQLSDIQRETKLEKYLSEEKEDHKKILERLERLEIKVNRLTDRWGK